MLELIGHPFSSYTWKVLIPLYEKQAACTFRVTGPDQPETMTTLMAHWPLGKFPLLIDGDRSLAESSIIIEYLDRILPQAPRLIPQDADAALDVRFMDRLFDNHVMAPMQAVVNEYLIDADSPDAARITRAKAALDTAYDWLEARLAGKTWACGEDFTLADCAAAPSLFYADWVHEIGAARPVLSAYRARLLARPSVARCVEDARPFRAYFPPGAPDRD
ncbi:glutathione S-transferase family protein [Sphingobium sp. H39-3-25]|uniref:glutathione S-transferase family protein n=1 Tax=Sphingobium arseniciresistens TaxID=3030834 RepID=UPI0023B8BE34|nr:glutathione S-transferase family protein [Sphingobium arseniciresistens]